jgi:type IV pilus assembly protein PilF
LLLAACASTSNGSQQKKVEQNTKGSEINVQLAIGYLEQEKSELALEKINRALQMDPRSADAHTVAGVIKERIGQTDEAERHYARSVKLDPENGDLLNNYGTFLCKTGQVEKAVEHFRDAIDQPFYSTPAVALGNACFCLFKEDRFEEGERYCRQAIEEDAQFGDPYYLLAEMFLAQGEAMRARAFLQRYQSVAQDTPATLKLCIDIEQKMGDTDTVAECLKQLRTSFPSSPELKEVEARIDNESAN